MHLVISLWMWLVYWPTCGHVTKLYCLLTESRVCDALADSRNLEWNGRQLKPQPVDCKSDVKHDAASSHKCGNVQCLMIVFFHYFTHSLIETV